MLKGKSNEAQYTMKANITKNKIGCSYRKPYWYCKHAEIEGCHTQVEIKKSFDLWGLDAEKRRTPRPLLNLKNMSVLFY